MLDLIIKIDNKILNFYKNKRKSKIVDKIMLIATACGDMGIIWIVIAALLLKQKSTRDTGIMVIAALVFESFVVEGIIKNVVKRSRPFSNDINEDLLIGKPLTYSFPSGHTASSFAVSAIFVMTYSYVSIIILILALIISFSRIYLRVHYTSDVLFGGIIGFLCGIIIIWAFKEIAII